MEFESETVMALRLKRISTLQFRVPLIDSWEKSSKLLTHPACKLNRTPDARTSQQKMKNEMQKSIGNKKKNNSSFVPKCMRRRQKIR